LDLGRTGHVSGGIVDNAGGIVIGEDNFACSSSTVSGATEDSIRLVQFDASGSPGWTSQFTP
jgi:hypothetical protein